MWINTVTIGLPAGWTPAYPNQVDDSDNSFGDNPVAKAPTTGDDETSYVVLTHKLKFADDLDLDKIKVLNQEDAASVDVVIAGDPGDKIMEEGDRIRVTFHNREG